jgi:hypothetical protein
MKRPVLSILQYILEASHDWEALVTRSCIRRRFAFGQASDHGEEQFLLDSSGNRWLREHIRNSRGELTSSQMQISQPR